MGYSTEERSSNQHCADLEEYMFLVQEHPGEVVILPKLEGPRKPQPKFGWHGQAVTAASGLPYGYRIKGVKPGDLVRITKEGEARVLDPDLDHESDYFDTSIYMEVTYNYHSGRWHYQPGYRGWWAPGSISTILQKS